MLKQYSIFKFEFFSAIFTLVLGTILHFTFDWHGANLIVGAFSAVNESTWEHLKLIFFPMLISSIVGFIYFKKEFPNYLCVKTKGILLALSFIVIFFYTYTGILEKNLSVLDIGSFIVAVILAEYYTLKNISNKSECNNFVQSIILIALFLCFILFTFFPPHIGLFMDPITGNYGIS
ncbi:MAG: hypothetical protein E7310_02950 [Clostridiales bacterium]|nr:hypothetical protein [Clostridiales bacterium]